MLESFALQGFVERLNEMTFRDTEPSKYATLFCALLNTNTGELDYVNAGHVPPYLVSGGTRATQLKVGGLPVGLFKDAKYEVGHAQLLEGETIVLYTDGVTEAENHEGELFGEHRLAEAITAMASSSASDLKDAIGAQLGTFSAGTRQSDDLTLLVGKLVPSAERRELGNAPMQPTAASGG